MRKIIEDIKKSRLSTNQLIINDLFGDIKIKEQTTKPKNIFLVKNGKIIADYTEMCLFVGFEFFNDVLEKLNTDKTDAMLITKRHLESIINIKTSLIQISHSEYYYKIIFPEFNKTKIQIIFEYFKTLIIKTTKIIKILNNKKWIK